MRMAKALMELKTKERAEMQGEIMAMNLIEHVLKGEKRAIARLMSIIEDNGPQAREALAQLYPHTGQAHIVGVTGATGTGKSTLVNYGVILI